MKKIRVFIVDDSIIFRKLLIENLSKYGELEVIGYAVDAFLVDCSDNTLKAHRLIRMNPEFSRKFRMLLNDDQQKEFDPAAYEQAVSNVYRMYSTKDLLKLSVLKMKGTKQTAPVEPEK